jgi:hypothetical protein
MLTSSNRPAFFLSSNLRRWTFLVMFNVAALSVLGLYRASSAQAPQVNPPFANAVDQQAEIINQLKEVNRQLRDQNALLRSGALHVVISDKKN